MNSRRTSRLLATLLCAGGLGCGDETGPAVTSGALEIVSGDGQGVLPGEPAPEPLRVRVTGTNAQPLPGITVSWAIAAGDATLTPAQSTTNARGEAETHLTLNEQGTSVEVRASVQGLAPVSFSMVAVDPCLTSSARPFALGSSVTGRLQPADCDLADAGALWDLYKMVLGTQQGLTLRLRAPTFDPFVAIFRKELNGGYFDRGWAVDTVSASRTVAATWILTAGEYIVGTTSWDLGGTGEYELIASAASSGAEQCQPVFVTPGVTTEQQLAASDCADAPGPFYRDVFYVVLWRGERVMLAQSSTAFAPRLRLLRPSGALVAEAGGGTTGTALIEFTSDETSRYTVHATSAVSESAGAYTLAVINPAGAPTGSVGGATAGRVLWKSFPRKTATQPHTEGNRSPM